MICAVGGNRAAAWSGACTTIWRGSLRAFPRRNGKTRAAAFVQGLCMRMSLGRASAALLRAVRMVVGDAADGAAGRATDDTPLLAVSAFESEPWASLTFSGARHRLEVRLEGRAAQVREARARLAASLAEMDLTIPGQFLADSELVDAGCIRLEHGCISLNLRLMALTIEE